MPKIAAAMLIGLLSTWDPAAADPRGLHWQGAWGHPPTAYNFLPPTPRPDGRNAAPLYAPLPPYRDVTVRQVVRLSAPARGFRLRVTNEFGDKSLRLGAVHVALAGDGSAIVPGSDHVVTFAGKASAEIPPGAPLLSDTIAWPLPAFIRLAITIHYPYETVPPAHTIFTLNAWQTAGDRTSDISLANALPARTGLHISEIDILPERAGRTLVTFGDSITEGVVSMPGAFRSYADRLAERLQANAATRGWSVVNAGIGSNRLLHDTPSTNALSRFDRDVLAVPRVKAVIVLLAINDIQYTHRYPDQAVHAEQEIAALRQLIERAHAAGVKIFGATVMAFEGSPDYTPEGEADRQAVNDFIRSGAFDGLVDFDAATRDPARPSHLRPDLESDGHLHPNDAGYRVMGDSVDLSLFR